MARRHDLSDLFGKVGCRGRLGGGFGLLDLLVDWFTCFFFTSKVDEEGERGGRSGSGRSMVC